MVMMVMSCSDHIVTIANASNPVKRICAEFEATALLRARRHYNKPGSRLIERGVIAIPGANPTARITEVWVKLPGHGTRSILKRYSG